MIDLLLLLTFFFFFLNNSAEVKILFGTSREHVEVRAETIAGRSNGCSVQKERNRFRFVVETIARINWQCTYVVTYLIIFPRKLD